MTFLFSLQGAKTQMVLYVARQNDISLALGTRREFLLLVVHVRGQDSRVWQVTSLNPWSRAGKLSQFG